MMEATTGEVAAWNNYAGSCETVESYNEDLNSGASGLHPTSVRAFHAGRLGRDELLEVLEGAVSCDNFSPIAVAIMQDKVCAAIAKAKRSEVQG